MIPLGVNWDEFAQLPEPGGFRSRIGVDQRAKVILFVGRIHPTKGLDLLLHAFALARREVADAHLVAVGWDHGFLATARHLSHSLGVAGAVTFAGPIFGADRLAAYVDADVFAMTPPVFEETSLAALEAAASGTQCVMTRQCEIPGLEASGAGRVVECDRYAIAAALIESLQPGIPECRGRRARAMVATHFTASAVATEHERFYEEVIVQGRDGPE
jgi:glycosyltransferase involved in cell wall biosynthesis